MKGKPKTTTQRIYLEDFERVKKFQELNQIPTFAEAFHRYVEHLKDKAKFFKEELENRDRLLELKNQKLYEVLETNKALQKRIRELERELEEARDRIREVEAKWAEVSEENLELRAKLNKSFWQRLKGFLRL